MRLLPAALTAALLAWVVLPPVVLESDCRNLGVGVHADPGEALLHRIKPRFSQEASIHMPLTSLWATETCRHSGPASFKLQLALSLAAPCLLVLILGSLLGSPWAAVLALALTVAIGWGAGFTLQWIYSAFVLLVAAVLVWRAQAPSLWKSLLLGLSIGASLLYRSPLVFFPPLLVLYEYFFHYRRSIKTYWKHALVLLLAPYLVLVPWILMNWADQRRFIPLENGESDCIVITGALGLVRSTLGDCRGLLTQEPPPRGKGGIVGWAIAQVIQHPLPYAKACLTRLTFVFNLQPQLFLAALAALWLLRKRKEVQLLAFFSLYFLMVHCLLAIQPHYFIPLWPLLAAIAALLLDEIFCRLKYSLQAPPRQIAAWSLQACLLLVACLCFKAYVHMLAYSLRAAQNRLRSDISLDESIQKAPRDAWLLSERGRREFERGKLKAALGDFSRALSLNPQYEHYLNLARVLALNGKLGPLLMEPSFPEMDAYPHHNALLHLLRALVQLERGNEISAQKEFLLAHNVLAPRPPGGQIGTSAPEKKVMTAMASASKEHFNALLQESLISFPPHQRQKFLKKLLSRQPENGHLLVLSAETAEQARDRKTALALARRAEEQSMDFNEQLRLISLYKRMEALDDARRILSRMTSKFFSDTSLLLLQAEISLQLKQPAKALQLISRAERLNPDDSSLFQVAHFYTELAEHSRSLSILERLCEKNPGNPEFWAALAETQAFLRRPDHALVALDQAASLKLHPGLRNRIARLYKTLGQDERSLALLENIKREPLEELKELDAESDIPGQIAALYCELGRPEQALAILKHLGPKYEKPGTLLILAHTAQKKGNRDLALASLSRAQKLGLSASQEIQAAMLYRELGEPHHASALLQALLVRDPRDPAIWIEQALLAIAISNKTLALRSLSQAAALNPSAELRRHIALAYQNIKEYPLALSTWNGILAEKYPQASDFSDRAISLYFSGAIPQALTDLKTALRLDPAFLPACSTLGSIYESQGHFDRARETYEAALSSQPKPEMETLWADIEKRKNRLLTEKPKRKGHVHTPVAKP